MATNLGPGVSDMCMDTFRLLKKDPVKQSSEDGQIQVVKDSLAKKVDVLVRQRQEFENQIREFNEKKEREF